MNKYNFAEIEVKWQKRWQESHAFAASNHSDKPKFYALVEFPYPSGAGLHVGHPRPYTAMDVIVRKRRMDGYNVLFPIGYDAFGLPTENFAIKNHVHPAIVTKQNIENFTRQLHMLGYSFDWDRVVDTTDPSYYKWTQWIFLQLFKHGLAYKTSMPVNWCTSCKCVLANEEVVNGVCERCGSEVVRKEKSQWMLKITEYAQKLIDGLDDVDFIERVKTQQRNWIGRSTGAEVVFPTTEGDSLTVYTTRCDTLFGATYMVIAPEHACVKKWADKLENYDEVERYAQEAGRKSDFERTELVKDKTGVELKGVRAINPLTGKEIPIFISDYVLASYGTGAIMAVPAHDSRDWDFAKAFDLPIIQVVANANGEEVDVQKAVYTDVATGVMVNSGFITGLSVEDAQKKMIEYLEEKGIGHAKVNYKLRDWVFSRQRYWGEPIPIVKCPKCGYVPLPEEQLPLLLPEVESYEPTDNGESPIAKMRDWVETTCPCCGGPAERETDTMPQWAGSSWYFLRYMDPHNDNALASKEALEYWGQVDWYNGGMEHTTLHLLYSRFWNNFLHDIGVVPYAEPYAKRTSHGMILGKNPHYIEYAKDEAQRQEWTEKYGNQVLRPSVKMSKSLGNVVNPDDVIKAYGADTMRLYIMFIGDFEKTATWSDEAVKGCKKFLDRVWNLFERCGDSPEYSPENEAAIHKAIKKVSSDIEAMKFNTAIATLMALVNDFYAKGLSRGDYRALMLMLSPFAPHMCEELWEMLGEQDMICRADWPTYDESKTIAATVQIAVQVQGKLKANVVVPADAEDEAVVSAAMAEQKIARLAEGKTLLKSIVVRDKQKQLKLVNLILK
ncbi:MAG: leucine--tRNA ligase [Oscillospiraceae bacterium]|nr:leucine--tRNA ligase [Oscillospiraceae bacterium]